MSTNAEADRHEEGAVLLERRGAVAVMTLSRPGSLNALTWTMYEQLAAHFASLAADDAVRVVMMRGAGKAFAAGTDIGQFVGFSGADGVAYERKMQAIIESLYNFPKPVVAAIRGYAVGAGIALACACDLRYATPESRFGAPIARTLGNCLSIKNYQHLVACFGPMRAKEMLFTARLLTADDALQCGFLTAIVEEERIFTHAFEVAQRISELAPLTIWATREAHRRMSATEPTIPFDDVVTRIYGSRDFAEGVKAYLEKRKPQWEGR